MAEATAAGCSRQALIDWCTTMLAADGFADYGPNGLQVAGRERISRLATGTTASLATITAALAAGADALLVHHGLFWGSGPVTVTGILKPRLQQLLGADCNLLAYHLPLDAHPEHGNNAEALRRIGASDCGEFALYRGRAIGRIGQLARALGPAELAAELTTAFSHDVIHCPGGPDQIRTVGVITGGGQNSLTEAAAAGCDAFITGETSEQSWHEAAELGCHLFACGHHATECLAIHRLGVLAANQLAIEHVPLAETNPL